MVILYVSLIILALLVLALVVTIALKAQRKSLQDQQALDRMTEQLDQSKQRYADLFNNIEAAIWSLDTATNRMDVSSGYVKLIGYSREEFTRNADLWKEVVYADDVGVIDEHMAALYNGQASTFEHRIVQKNGDIRWVECICTPVIDPDNRVSIIGIVRDITVKKKTREQLEQNRLLLQNLLDTVDVGAWTYDEISQKVLYTSEALSKITGYPAERFAVRDDWKGLIHPDDISTFESLSERVRQGAPDVSEYRIVHAKGDIRWVQVRIIPTMDSDRQVRRLDGVVVDITSQKLMEEALHRSEQRYKSLFEHNTDVICEVDLNGKILAVNPSAETVTGKRIVDLVAGISLAEIFGSDAEERMSEYFNGAKRGQTHSCEITSIDASGNVYHWDMKKVPIYINNEIVGAFAICRDITSRMEIEAALANSEALYRLIAENMTDFLGVVDVHGTFLYASPSYQRGLGQNVRLMLGKSAFEFVHPEDWASVRTSFSATAQTAENIKMRFRYLHVNGDAVFVDCIGTPVVGDAGKVERIVVVARNITEQVQMESELVESDNRYHRLIELSPQPMAFHREGSFLYINPECVRFLGAKDADGVIGKHFSEIIHPDDWEKALRGLQLVIEQKFVHAAEYEIIRLDGKNIEAETTSIYDHKSQSTLTVFNDITARRNMEAALRESEARHRGLVELSPVAIAVCADNKLVYVNPTAMKVAGASRSDELIGMDVMELVHPEDREIARNRLVYTQREGISSPGEYRMIRLDGEVVDVSVSSIYDANSSSLQIVFEDITARKGVERALMESEELNRYLVELSPEAIVLHTDYKFSYVNPAGLALFGASSMDSLVGQSIFDYIHPDCRERTAARLAGVYEHYIITPHVEQTLRRPDGTYMEVEVIAAPIPYKGANAGVSLFRDITERKQAEEDRKLTERMVRTSEERYSRLQSSVDRLSQDLFGVLKISEMERRLIQELRDVLGISNVQLLEVDRSFNEVIQNGQIHIPASLLEVILTHEQLPICEIMDTPDGYFIKIGDIRDTCYVLCIGEASPTLQIPSKRVWLKTITRFVSVLFDNFRVIEDLTNELAGMSSPQETPSWLLRLLFSLSENERKRLSQDLHDSALQEQIVWYRKLDQLSTDPAVPQELQGQLQGITQGLLDVIYQIRMMCNELRPPLLKEEGLVSSLGALFEFTQLRADYSIQFDASEFDLGLHDDLLIGFYRIVQELLANAAKHSNATKVQFRLSSHSDRIQLAYEDNGIGMDVCGLEDSFERMGVYGIKERVRSMDGEIEFCSSPNRGLGIFISIPLHGRTETISYSRCARL